MGRTHALSGAVLGLAVCAAVPPPPMLAPVVVLVCALAAFAPDLDHPNSTATRALPPVTWLLCRLIRWLSRLLTGVSHRGFSHSPVFAAGIGLLAWWATGHLLPGDTAVWTGIAAGAGCWIGAIGDELTSAGNRFAFWPVARIRWPDVLRFRTGGRGEQVVVALLALAGVGLVTGSWAW
ncbi:metal-dependent hydrolase [Pseudonocardia sp. NPDC049635]|uniref:metal-dependent hydrolase n=1 Tax=Pseudonocardia sp. NPDC049635 TaxID=3155506 RepID=UPI0034043C0C